MSAKATQFATDFLNHVLNNLAIANIGDAAGLPAGTAGSLYVGLYSADPGAGGDQTTNELSYTGYARVAAARDNTWWTVASGSASNAKAITFAQCTAGSGTAAWAAVGTASSGTGHLLYRLPLVATFYDCVGESDDNSVTAPGSSFSVNDPIVFGTLPNGSVPGGITAGTIYFVKTATADAITISATAGGATITITSDGVATVGKISTLAISQNITPSIAIGAATLTES